MRVAPLIAALCCLAAPLKAEVRWQLDCTTGQVGTMSVKGAEGAGVYAYLTLTVTNKTGREVPLSLGVWAETDVPNRTYRGLIDPVVKDAVEKQTGKTYKSLTEARGPIADGASVDILVSFGKIDGNVHVLDTHVLGLLDRVYRDKGKTYVEDKALVLHLERTGDEFERQNDLLKIKGSPKWVVLAPAKELKRA
jgi:hypothetical protein